MGQAERNSGTKGQHVSSPWRRSKFEWVRSSKCASGD